MRSDWGPGKTPQEVGLSESDALAYYTHVIDLANVMGVDTKGWYATPTGVVQPATYTAGYG